MARDAGSCWSDFFHNWPAEVHPRGVLVTTLNEQIPFENFAVTDDMVLLERRAPDTSGARLVVIAFVDVAAVKLVDVLKLKNFEMMGFEQPASRK